MYETRHQSSLHPDENIQGELKAAKGAAGHDKAVPPAAKTRRALGDIGNLVSAAAALRCKDSHAEAQIAEKKAPHVVDRPITRSFGAQLASDYQSANGCLQQQPTEQVPQADQEVVAAKSQKHASKTQEDSSVDSKDDNSEIKKDMCTGHPGHTKAPLSNHKRGKEKRGRTLTATLTARSEAACGSFKLEDVEEPVVNIDAQDVCNQLAVVDYVEDIYSFYRKAESQSCVPPDYMSSQTHINDKMRAILVDWLIEVHLKFKLMPETLFLTTNLLDRFLSVQTVDRKTLQLVGMTAMLVASKYEEIWAPEIHDFVMISDDAYTREQILEMEKLMLNTLRFNLCVPTPYMFLVRFLKAAASNQEMNMLAFYFVELCLVNFEMLKFSPSKLAAAAVYLAHYTLRPEEVHWSATLKCHSGYMESQLIECASLMVALHEGSGKGNLTIVRKKYSHTKYCSVALLSTPALPATAETATGGPIK